MNCLKAKTAIFACLFITGLQVTALAQDDAVATALAGEQKEPVTQEQQRRIELSRELFVDTQKQNARMGMEAPPKSHLRIEREFINAVPQFRRAVASYREAISLNSSLKDPLKTIERYVSLFKTYFKSTRVDAPVVDKGEFNTFSRKDLLWESLTAAERMDTQLRLAMFQMQEAITTETVSIDTVLFMRDLHGDLLRFDLLLSKVK
jgi:hypothetical protein